MDKHNIIRLLAEGERVTLECKKAQNAVPTSLWNTYSAFANTIGGTILLGIFEDVKEKDKQKRFQIVGVEDAQKLVTDFWNIINSSKVNENILRDDDVEIVNVDGVQVVCIHVPQADWRLKPIYLNENIYKGTYRRNHEGDYRCTERQVKTMIRDSFEEGNDGLLLEHYGMDDIDLDTLHRYRTLFQFRNDGHVWNEVDDKTFLRNLGGYVANREAEKEGLSMAGLMMFGKGLPIRERFYNFRMDYLNFCNLVGEERYSDRLTYDGRWENNLYQFFSIVASKMTFDLPRPFRMEGIQRVDDTPQHKAVREAFTNAVIHADLMMDAGILRIEKHDDKLCFRNPGLLRLPIEQIYDGGNSKARNPRIQNMLRMIGYGENVGSGFPTIIAAWKTAGWGEPELKNKVELDEVELVLPVPSMAKSSISTQNIGKEMSDVLKNVLKSVPKDIINKLTDRQIDILELICESPTSTWQDMSKRFNVSDKTIQRDFSTIRNLGIGIVREGGKTYGNWIIKIEKQKQSN